MYYPQLKPLKTERQMVDVFRGYNHNLRISGGEFFNTKNLTSDYYPVLSPRGKRGIYANLAAPMAIIAKESVCYVDGPDFVIGENRIAMSLSTKHEDCPKQLISMGAYVIILPDKKYINTADVEDRGSIEAQYVSDGDVTFSLCRVDGSAYNAESIQATAPENPANGALWVDTATKPNTLKQWSEASGMWASIATTYVKIAATGIGIPFQKYDGVQISGLTEAGDNVAALEGSAVIWDKGDDYIVVVGIMDEAKTVKTPVTVARKMPAMDFVVESNNRLWGCRYGLDETGEMVNRLYASKLGDFKNWNCYMSLSTDSYYANVGTDGAFTGAITHLGSPLFFKENCLHKVYGSTPAEFSVLDTACRGVMPGCHNSLAIVNEILFYKSRNAICSYDGSLPTEVSYVLGNDRYSDAVAGAHGSKYYISMKDSMDVWHLFVFDTAKGLWHREDNLKVSGFCSHKGEMYCISDYRIITLLGSGDPYEEEVHWEAETGELGISSPDMKYISRITLRMAMEPGSSVDVYAQYDMSDEWVHLCRIFYTSLRSFSIPIRPRRCDFMRLKFVGTGGAKIYSMTKTIEQGSELS